MEIKIVKNLDSGAISNTYIANYGKEKVILKIGHVLLEESSDAISILEQFDEVARKLPNHLLTCKSISIIPKCDLKHVKPENFRSKSNSWYAKLHNSDKCLQTIYTPILENNLLNLINNQFSAMDAKIVNKLIKNNINPDSIKVEIAEYRHNAVCVLVQIFYIYDFMFKNNWVHADLHIKNIMYRRTTAKSIPIILGKNKINLKMGSLKTQIYFIDYDLMYKRTGEYDKTIIGKYIDYVKTRNNQHFILMENVIYFIRRPEKYLNVNKLYTILANNPTTKALRKYIPKAILEEPETAELCLFALSVILETETFLELIGYKNDELLVKATKSTQIFTEKDIIFIVRNLCNPATVIKYFVKMIN